MFIWTGVPAFVTTMGSVATGIIRDTCVSWGVYSSYSMQRAMGTTIVFCTYILPLAVTVFCYTRIVYALLARPVSVSQLISWTN